MSLPIPLRLLVAAHPELVTPMLQMVQHVVTRHLLDHDGLTNDGCDGDAATLNQRVGF